MADVVDSPSEDGARPGGGSPPPSDVDADAPPTKAGGAPPSSGGGAPTVSLDEEMDAVGLGRFHGVALAVLGLANASDAVELLALSFILPSLRGVSDAAKAALSASIFVGMLLGGLVFGVASDALGRRATLSFSLAVNAAFGLLSAAAGSGASFSLPLLAACRVLGGFGVGGSIPGVFSLAAELLPSRGRGFWLSTVAWWWMVGSLWAAGGAWVMIGVGGLPWQAYAAFAAVPAALAAVLVRACLPESPRFLLRAGDAPGAAAAIARIARANGVGTRLSKGYVLAPLEVTPEEAALAAADAAGDDAEGDDVDLLLSVAARAPGDAVDDGSSRGGGGGGGGGGGAGVDDDKVAPRAVGGGASDLVALRAARATAVAGAGGPPPGVGARKPSTSSRLLSSSSAARARRGWASLPRRAWRATLAPLRAFFAPGLRRTAGLLMVVWFALSFGWYGLILWIPTLFEESDIKLDIYQDSFLVAAANLPGNVLSALFMDRLGRRGVLVSSLLAACACAAGMPFARSEVAAVAVACTLNAVSTASWNALDCLSTESFPTHLRSTAMGVLAATGRVGSIAGQFLFGLLATQPLGALLGPAAAVLAAGAAAAALLPSDPMGRALDD